MSRFEKDFTAVAGAPLSAGQLADLLGGQSGLSVEKRQEAIACYLSGSDGWREALKALGGAFASDAGAIERLTGDKAG